MNEKIQHSIDEAPKGWDARQIKRRASFLQSGLWAKFQNQQGHRVHFLEDEDWSCLLIERKTPVGSYLFAPYGPTLLKTNSVKSCLEQLKGYTRQAGTGWLTLEPMLAGAGSSELRGNLTQLGGKKTHNREPDLTRILDLTPAADQILAGISQSTRSFIRKNQRENLLSFRTSADPKDIKMFLAMLKHVTDRNDVFFFSDEYFQKQAEVLMPGGMLHLEVALKGNLPVASALFHDYGGGSSYTYAASLPKARQTNASALLLWQAILNAKERGVERMDLFGIAPDDGAPSHPWHGFSSFKKKFGGEVVAYAGTWDFPLSPNYRLYNALRRLRPGH